jgi:hypothetical protein
MAPVDLAGGGLAFSDLALPPRLSRTTEGVSDRFDRREPRKDVGGLDA